MKKTRIFLISLLLGAALVSCTKDSGENLPASIDADGINLKSNGGNVTCEEVAAQYDCDFDYTSGKMDYDGGSGGTVGPITWTTDGTYVTWTSTVPVKIAIIVKGGPNAEVYFSGCDDDCLTSGTGLTAPINPNNGKPYGLSNITFCYSECEEEEELVIALKSYIYTPDGSRMWVTTGGIPSNIVYYPFIPGDDYPLYLLGNLSDPIGNLMVGNFDSDIYTEVKISFPIPPDGSNGYKFVDPYLFVGTIEESVGLWYTDYPYPPVKADLDPPVSEVILDLPF